jgi:hypothetical protein
VAGPLFLTGAPENRRVMNSTSVLQTITEEISPYLGLTMARSSVDLHCRTLKIERSGMVTGNEVEALLQKLAMGLNIFIGKEKTASVIESIRLKVRR